MFLRAALFGAKMSIKTGRDPLVAFVMAGLHRRYRRDVDARMRGDDGGRVGRPAKWQNEPRPEMPMISTKRCRRADTASGQGPAEQKQSQKIE
jgi:hypothetical protein